MFMNGEASLIGGGLLAVGAGYALISMFVTGPLIGERMIERLNWAARCERLISDEVTASEPVAATIPSFGCGDILGTLFGSEGADFCDHYGGMIDNNPLTQSAEAAAQAQREAGLARRELALSRAGTRCECAVSMTLEERRVPLAIFGGSARLVTPPSIGLLNSELEVHLNSHACSMKG